MDPEKFDKVVLDLLYEELDELTHASATRHLEQSAQARALYSELRAVREIGQLPWAEPPDDIEDRILRAEREARATRPLKQRLGSAVSVLAGYAMRPELAMAALLMLMIGASLIFLRATPGDHRTVQVTERGVPESEGEAVAIASEPESKPQEQAHGVLRTWREPPASAPSPEPKAGDAENDHRTDEGGHGERLIAARDDGIDGRGRVASRARSAAGGAKKSTRDAGKRDTFEEAMLAYRSQRYSDAEERFDTVAASGGPNAATASLFAARATKESAGCGAAVERFERIRSRYAGTGVALEARWLAAECYERLGQTDRARQQYEALAEVPQYQDKVRAALAGLSPTASGSAKTDRPAAAAAKPAAAAAERSEK